MQNQSASTPWRAILGIFALLTAAFVGAGALFAGNSYLGNPLSKSATTVVVTATAPAPTAKPTTKATAKPAPAPTTTGSPADLKEAMTYLQSASRVKHFMEIVPRAGIVIAQGLQNGKFGPVFRYDSDKIAKQPGYTGWGGIMSTNHQAFAWVYWNADGSIDYTKPITQVSISNVHNDPATNVFMFAPLPYVKKTETEGSYWTVYLSANKKLTEVTDTNNFQSSFLASTMDHPNGGFFYPSSMVDLEVLDVRGLNTLVNNTNQWFGTGWDS